MLRLNNPKKYLKIGLISLFVLLLAGITLRLVIWERHYYDSQEGKERTSIDITNPNISQNNVDESDVTEDHKDSHQVFPTNPRYLSIPKLGVTRSRVLAMGTDTSGRLQSPSNIFDVGWYQKSNRPGHLGTAIFDGHNGGPSKHGVFKELPSLNVGDEILVELGNGTVYKYAVHDNFTVPLSEADRKMRLTQVSPVQGKESISLITCTGEWSQSRQTYLSRQFLRAVRID